MLRKSLFPIVIMVAIYSCKSDEAAPPISAAQRSSRPATRVEAFVVKTEVLDNIITTQGSILPNEEVELRSEMEGTIVSINFEEGSSVRKGQLLVQIDDSELQPNLRRLQSELKTAKEEYGRKRQLLDIEGISKEDYEAAELKVATLESEIQLIRAQIQKSKILAPFNGTIGLRQVSRGAFVSAGSDIARLVQSDPVKIEFSVPELNARQIRRNITIEFTLAGSDKKYTATVFATEPAIDPGTRSLKVRAITGNKNGELIPGAYVELSITLDKITDGMLVPVLAVNQDIKGLKLFVISNGVAKAKYVKTGLQKGDMVQVTEGILPGDTIITTSLLSMRDGMPVKAKSVQSNTGATL